MDLSPLAALITAGASAALPTKMGVDLIKKAVPETPGWILLILAFVFGEAIVFLVGIASGMPFVPNTIASAILTGASAAAAAISATELHKSARSGDVTVEKVSDEIEARLRAKPDSEPPEWLPPTREA